MRAKQKRRLELLTWRYDQYGCAFTHNQLADSLSVENLTYEEIPYRFYKALKEFRRLTRISRRAACQAFIGKTKTEAK